MTDFWSFFRLFWHFFWPEKLKNQWFRDFWPPQKSVIFDPFFDIFDPGSIFRVFGRNFRFFSKIFQKPLNCQNQPFFQFFLKKKNFFSSPTPGRKKSWKKKFFSTFLRPRGPGGGFGGPPTPPTPRGVRGVPGGTPPPVKWGGVPPPGGHFLTPGGSFLTPRGVILTPEGSFFQKESAFLRRDPPPKSIVFDPFSGSFLTPISIEFHLRGSFLTPRTGFWGPEGGGYPPRTPQNPRKKHPFSLK